MTEWFLFCPLFFCRTIEREKKKSKLRRTQSLPSSNYSNQMHFLKRLSFAEDAFWTSFFLQALIQSVDLQDTVTSKVSSTYGLATRAWCTGWRAISNFALLPMVFQKLTNFHSKTNFPKKSTDLIISDVKLKINIC